jgi:hypothetical protein
MELVTITLYLPNSNCGIFWTSRQIIGFSRVKAVVSVEFR